MAKGWGYTKPPLGSQINWGHPLANGMLGCWLFNEGGGSKILNIASPLYHGTLTTNGLTDTTWKGGLYGLVVSHSNAHTSNGVTIPALTSTTTHTLATWVKLTSIASSYQNLLGNSGTSGYWTLSGKLNSYTGAADKLSTTAVSTGVWVFWICSVLAGNATFYLNGVADGTATGIPSYPFNGMLCDNGASEQFTGSMSHQYLWVGRALTASDARTLYTDPFCMIQFPRRRNITGAAAAAATSSPRLTLLGVGG